MITLVLFEAFSFICCWIVCFYYIVCSVNNWVLFAKIRYIVHVVYCVCGHCVHSKTCTSVPLNRLGKVKLVLAFGHWCDANTFVRINHNEFIEIKNEMGLVRSGSSVRACYHSAWEKTHFDLYYTKAICMAFLAPN